MHIKQIHRSPLACTQEEMNIIMQLDKVTISNVLSERGIVRNLPEHQ